LLTRACLFIEASTVLVREIAERVQIFGSVASSRSRLHVAMRNPRQSRCATAIGRYQGVEAPRAKHWREVGIRPSAMVDGQPHDPWRTGRGWFEQNLPGLEPFKRARNGRPA